MKKREIKNVSMAYVGEAKTNLRPILLNRHVETVARVAFAEIRNHPYNSLGDDTVMELIIQWTNEFFKVNNLDVFAFDNNEELESYAKEKLKKYKHDVLDRAETFVVTVKIEHSFRFKIKSPINEDALQKLAENAAEDIFEKVKSADIDTGASNHDVKLTRITIA